MAELKLKPKLVTEPQMVFPAGVITDGYLPPMSEIPDEFSEPVGGNPWIDLTEQWFANRLKEIPSFAPNEGVDAEAAYRHISMCLKSYDPKHEHKIAGCAYLMSLWFRAVRCGDKVWGDEDLEWPD